MGTIMEYLHNYFYRFKEVGTFKINFNSLSLDGAELKGKYVKGQYVRIIGSAVNDGVYKVVATDEDGLAGITLEGCLTDETFEGIICSLGVPKAFIKLVEDIEAYNLKHENDGAYVSESFGGYSYTKAVINGEVATWKNVFKTQLSPYRRMTDGLQWVKEVK